MTKSKKIYNDSITVELITWGQGHRYKVNDKWLKNSSTGVTGLLDKPALKFWACNMMELELLDFLQQNPTPSREEFIEAIEKSKSAHRKASTKAKDIGSMVHEWAELYAKFKLGMNEEPAIPKGKTEVDEKMRNGIIAFKSWIEEYDITFVDAERLVYSKKYKYGGLMDCKFRFGKEKIVHCGDYKAGSFEVVKDRAGNVIKEQPYKEHRMQVASYSSADIEECDDKYGNDWIMYFGKEDGEFRAFELTNRKDDYQAFLGLLKVKKWIDKIKKQ